jgi:hypothetical protein
MDNKQDRQFYWEVKQFMGKTPNVASQENQNSPSLVENIKNVLNKNELYRPSSFNPSISFPNTINQAIGAMEQSKKLGASNSAEHSNNIYGNAFANPPKNLNEDNVRWNPKEHTEEENKAWKIQLAAERVAREKADYEKLRKYRKENPQAYREQQEKEHNAKESARQKFEASKAGNKAVNNSGNNPKIDDANKAAYDAAKELMYQIQDRDGRKKSGLPINPNAVEDAAQKARDANERANKARSDSKSADKLNQRISPVYWVTHADFERATGHKYDAMSAEDRRLFFDLNASGKSNVSPTAGVGQGPAYDSPGWHSRSRPDNVPQFGTPEARYDVVDGQIANTTPQSRAKEAEEVASSESRLKAEKEEVESTRRAREQAKKIVGGELAMDYFKKWADRDTEELNKQKRTIVEPGREERGLGIMDYFKKWEDRNTEELNKQKRTIVEPGREERGLGIDVERGQFPIYPEGQDDSAYKKPREAPGSAVSDVVNSLISGAGKSVIEKGKDLGSTMKKSLMQTVPMQGQPAGGADPDMQRGQFPIYPEGQDDSAYKKPREAPGSAVSDAQRAVTDSAANTLKDIMRSGSDWMKKQSMNSPGVRYPEVGADPDIQRGQFPIYPEGQEDSQYNRKREAPSDGISNIVNSLISGAGKSVIEKGKDLGSTMKQSLMQTVPMQGQPAGGANPDIERGQFPIYPEGQSDSTYARPREAPGSAISDIINNLVKSVGDSGKNVADELERLIKLNTAQTTPNVIKDKLYGDSAVGGAGFDTQEKTPPNPPEEYYYPNPYDPSVKYDIDFGDTKILPDTISTGGMNQPMDLADFKDEEEEKVPQSSTDFVKDVVKPLKDAGEEQSAQEKINDILKNLGTPSSKKTSKRVKRKRKGTTGLAMVGEGVVVPDNYTVKRLPPVYPEEFPPVFSGKELRKELIGNPNPVPTFTGAAKGVANTVLNPKESAKSAVNMAKQGTSAIEYAAKNPIPAAASIGKTGLQLAGAVVLPLAAGELARRGAEVATNYFGLDPANNFNEVPNLSKEIESTLDWAAMAGAGQLYANALAGAPLTSNLATHIASGALGGALVPVASYGGFKAGEALRDVSTPEMLGLEVTDKTGKLRPKTYAETGEDVVNYVIGDSETDKNKEWRSRRGMPNQGKPEPTVYPNVAELQKRNKEERERQERIKRGEFIPNYSAGGPGM